MLGVLPDKDVGEVHLADARRLAVEVTLEKGLVLEADRLELGIDRAVHPVSLDMTVQCS